MSASRQTLAWARWVTAAIVAVALLVFAWISIDSGEVAKMEWSELALFAGSIATTFGAPYMVNRATFKYPEK